jgi:hypothetical protein
LLAPREFFMRDDPLTHITAQRNAHMSWAGLSQQERRDRTQPARDAQLNRFPDENAKKAYYLDLAIKSAKARRARSAAAEMRQVAADVIAAADALDGVA